MYLRSFEYLGVPPHDPWSFDEIRLGPINLLVGKSGSGKSRLINSLFNVGAFIAGDTRLIWGHWHLSFTHNKFEYDYELAVRDSRITVERLERVTNGSDKTFLVDRNEDRFLFLGDKIPQLAFERSAISLLKEEAEVRPVHAAFGMIFRRRFDADALASVRSVSNIPKRMVDEFDQSGFNPTPTYDLPLGSRLFLIQKYQGALHERIKHYFLDAFPEFIGWQIRKLKSDESPIQGEGIIPGLFLSEKNVSKQIPLTELSSGMQKVLLIITDVLSAPPGTVYMIDEYENSLGINAIDFLPDLLNDIDNLQTIITTHHPYLINAMPVEAWQILSRRGSNVSITRGSDRRSIYEASAQEAFVQLMNDPAYKAD